MASLNSITKKVGSTGVLTVTSPHDIVSNIEWVSYGTVVKSGKTLTINNAAENNAGTYTATFTYRIPGLYIDWFFWVQTVVAPRDETVTVTGTVTIVTNDLTDMVIIEGKQATFSIRATGGNITYQWHKNGLSIDAHSNEYIIPNTTFIDHPGTYYLLVNSTYLTSVSKLSIIRQPPLNTTVGLTNSVTLQCLPTSNLSDDTGIYYWEYQLNGTFYQFGNSRNRTITVPATQNTITTFRVTVNNVTSNPFYITRITTPDPIVVLKDSPVTLTFANNTAGILTTPSYYWRYGTSLLLINNSSTYNINSIQYATTKYSVSVNSSYTVEFNICVVTSLPISATIVQGTNNTFYIGDTISTHNKNYSWYINGTLIAGANNNNYTVNKAQTKTTCYANINGVNLIPAVTLNIINKPLPVSATVNIGEKNIFSIKATLGSTIQWFNGANNLLTTTTKEDTEYTTCTYTISDAKPSDATTYYARVNGTQYSLPPIQLSVVTQYPTSITVNSGDNYTFSIATSGSSNYEWFKHGGSTGNKTASYTIRPISTDYATSYFVSVNGGQYSPSIFHISVVTAFSNSVTVFVGTNVTFNIKVESDTTVGYLWHKDVADTSNKTATYNIPSTTPDHAGSYYVSVNNQYDSRSITITIINNDTIDTICKEGNSAEFSIDVAGPATYQWYNVNTPNDITIAGATSNKYTINDVTLAHSGQYYVKVNNQYQSRSSTLTVVTTLIGSTVNIGEKNIFSITVIGKPVTYQWYKGDVIINNATDNSYTIQKVKDTDAATDATTYYVKVYILGTLVHTSAVVNLTIITQPPIKGKIGITRPLYPSSYTFSITAKAPVGYNPTYQWYRGNITNGIRIDGQTSKEYTLGTVAVTDSDNYYVRVNDQYNSTPVSLIIVGPPSIINDLKKQSIIINTVGTLHIDASGIDLTYKWYNGEAIMQATKSSTYIIASMQHEDEGNYRVIISTIGGEVTGNVAKIIMLTMPAFTSQPPIQLRAGENKPIVLHVDATGGDLEYYWEKYCKDISGSDMIDISGLSTDTFTILKPNEKSHQGIYSVTIKNRVGSTESNHIDLTIVPPPKFTVDTPFNMYVTINTISTIIVSATSKDTVYYEWFYNHEEPYGIYNIIPNATSHILNINTIITGDTVYYIRVYDTFGQSVTVFDYYYNQISTKNMVAIIQCYSKPIVASQPISQSLYMGQTNVSMSCSPDDTFFIKTYQWYKDGVAISDAIDNTYTIPVLSLSDNGVYTVSISVLYLGSVLSEGATLTVYGTPRITKQPDSYYRVIENGSITLCGNVTEGNITSQWRKDGVDIPGATNRLFTINNIRIDQAGQYTMYCTNQLGSIETEPYNVYVDSVECFPLQGSAGGLAGGGNSASGLTDLLIERNQRCAIQRVLPTERANICCPSVQVPLYNGGTSSAALLNTQMKAQAICTQASNKALALQRVSVPACPVSIVDSRFDKYQRRGPPIPCTPPPTGLIIPNNPAVPKAVDGYCVNVIGISQSRF